MNSEKNMNWEGELAGLLSTLTDTQHELLELLEEKRELLVQSDTDGLAELQPREAQLIERLQSCQQQRQGLLDQAAQNGLPNDSIRSLSKALPGQSTPQLRQSLDLAESRARLLKHQSLAQWVLVQRTLIHLSQMLEILATGGRPEPTYSNRKSSRAGGALVDQAV